MKKLTSAQIQEFATLIATSGIAYAEAYNELGKSIEKFRKARLAYAKSFERANRAGINLELDFDRPSTYEDDVEFMVTHLEDTEKTYAKAAATGGEALADWIDEILEEGIDDDAEEKRLEAFVAALRKMRKK